LAYLRLTGRSKEHVDLVERYTKEQGLWREKNSEPSFSTVLELDLATVTPSVAGPKRPQDRVELPNVRKVFVTAFADQLKSGDGRAAGRSNEGGAGGVAVMEKTAVSVG